MQIDLSLIEYDIHGSLVVGKIVKLLFIEESTRLQLTDHNNAD